MNARSLLLTEIPRPLIARAVTLIFTAFAFLCIYVVTAMTTHPITSGETLGEAAMSRGLYFITFGPFA
ncbi:MAG: hypothetical protein AAF725_24175, partial [Acidobacteriota bacterium]